MNTTLPARIKSVAISVAAAGLLAGCATSGNPKDPIEGFNRAMYAFNDGLDTAIIRPVATGYDAVLPAPVKTGVTNFFGNIEDVFIGVNNLLAGQDSCGGQRLRSCPDQYDRGRARPYRHGLPTPGSKSMTRTSARPSVAGVWATALTS
jgi:hypothetical protein